MANKIELNLGDHVSALRMSDKGIALRGKIVKIHDDSECVDILVDDTEDFRETVHAEDVTVLEAAPKAAAKKDDAKPSAASSATKAKEKEKD
jgi:hypothetical protein